METKFFQSDDLQQQFSEDGFVKINLLGPEEVEKLIQAYEPFRPAHERIGIPYITTNHSSNEELIRQVDSAIHNILAPAIDKYLTNYKLLLGNYLIKMPVAHSETAPHQDITFVNEEDFVSVNIWVALQDTDESNGCMYFLKGSHKFSPNIRPTHSYKWAYEDVKEQIPGLSVSCPAQAGQAFIFHHSAIHGSYANNSGIPRLAAVMAAYSADADLLHYFLPNIESKMVMQYSMTKEAFVTFKKELPPPKGVFMKEVEFVNPQLSITEFMSLVKPHTPKEKWSIFSAIRKIFQ